MKQITIFGASGKLGRKCIADAITRGFHVKAPTRTPIPFPGMIESLEAIQTTFDDSESLRSVIRDSQGVIIALGPRSSNAPAIFASLTTNIIRAMEAEGVQRLVCVTGAMIGDLPVRRTKFFQRLTNFINSHAPELAKDRTEQEHVIQRSSLDWTIVKPPRLTDSPVSGKVKAAPDLEVGLLSKISRKDLAQYILNELESPNYIRQAVVVHY
ncbi:MAG: NAD(P)H-binding protein [bacterium]